jgi:hypothetical protein
MMTPGTLVYQPVSDVTRMSSPINVAITSRFMPRHAANRGPAVRLGCSGRRRRHDQHELLIVNA